MYIYKQQKTVFTFLVYYIKLPFSSNFPNSARNTKNRLEMHFPRLFIAKKFSRRLHFPSAGEHFYLLSNFNKVYFAFFVCGLPFFLESTALITNIVAIISTIATGSATHALFTSPAIMYETNDTAATVRAYGS